MDRCATCPATGECKAVVVQNPRLCDLANPDSSIYSPAYRKMLAGGPSLLRKAVNLAGAVATHVAAGMPTVDDAEHERRLSICRGCEFFSASADTCLKCGCQLSIKARWKDQQCPVEKW